jgi:hypothetical protein
VRRICPMGRSACRSLRIADENAGARCFGEPLTAVRPRRSNGTRVAPLRRTLSRSAALASKNTRTRESLSERTTFARSSRRPRPSAIGALAPCKCCKVLCRMRRSEAPRPW